MRAKSIAALEHALQETPVTLALVLARADEGHRLPASEVAKLVELGRRLGHQEPVEIAVPALGPGHAPGLPVAEQREVGPELAEPEVDAVLADPARPPPHDEHAEPVGLLARLVDALEPDHALTLPRARAAGNARAAAVLPLITGRCSGAG